MQKCRLIWDDCTPTRERRPTTSQDVEDDIHVEEYDNDRAMLDQLLDLAGYDEEDLGLDEKISNKAKIEDLLSCLEDPGDGSPNVLYASIDRKMLKGSFPYDCLEGLDLESATREEIVKLVIDEFVEED